MGVSALELRRRVLMAQPHKERKTGGIVSFNTHVPQVLDVSVPLSPVQAGTGDPYPPGGGKNKYPIAIGEEALTNNGGATHSNNNGSLIINTVATSSASGVYANAQSSFRSIFESLEVPFTVSVEISATDSGNVRLVACGSQKVYEVGTEKQRISVTATSKSTINFNIYGVNNGATLTVSNLQIEEGSTATDFAPYSNIRPITGWTGATAWRTGKNLLPNKKYQYSATQVRLGGENSTEAYKKLKAGTYTLSVTGNVNVQCYYTHNSVNTFLGSNGGTLIVTEADEDKSYVFYCYKSGSLSADDVLTWQLELGATATEYAPYSGESFPFTFPDTVYGGRLEPAAGRVVVDRAKKTFNGSESWGVYAHATYGNTFRVPIVGKLIAVGLSICDAFTNISDCWESNGRGRHGVFSDHTTTNSLYFRAPNASVDDLAAWTAWLSENPVTVVYYLATPVEIPLTPAEIRALMGENNVFSDAVDVEVEFWTN